MTMRECLVEPSPPCFRAAALLSSAVDAHLAGDRGNAARLIHAADIPEVRAFTETVWGSGGKERHGYVNAPSAPPYLRRADRPVPRMPTLETQAAVIQRDGYHCRFCGLPVIRPAVRDLIRRAYPDVLGWGSTNPSQHAAFQCLWLQFDHVLPNSRGGPSTVENVVVTCAPRNFGRMEATLEEARLVDPLARPTPRNWAGFDSWDGLERFGVRS